MWDLIVSVPDHCLSFYFVRDCMADQSTCRLDDSIKSEGAILRTIFSPLYVYGKIVHAQGRVTPKRNIRSGPESNSSEILWLSIKIYTCKVWQVAILRTTFSPIYVYGRFQLPWKPEFWFNLPQNLMLLFPHQNDAKVKIWSRLANWPQRYSSLKVWTTTTTEGNDDRRRTIGILRAYKLTLWT